MSALPLVIGIAGHRHLDSPSARVRRECRALCESVVHRLGNTPCVVLSSLADGADQLFTEVALASGMHLVAVLPMPPLELRKELSDREQFDRLLAQADRVEVVRGDALNHYANAAAEIARRVHLLVAIWNLHDDETPKAGGTAFSVGLRRGYLPAGDLAWRMNHTGPCWIIATQTEDHDAIGTSRPPNPCAELDELAGDLRRLNLDLSRDSRSTDCVRTYDSLRSRAASAARTVQRYSFWQHRAISLITLVAFACQQLGNYLEIRGLEFAAVGATLTLMLVLWLARRRVAHARHLQLRSLAEIMRVVASVPRVLATRGVTGLLQSRGLAWLTRAAAEWAADADSERIPVRRWIHGQQQYFHRAGTLTKRLERRLNLWSWAAYFASVAVMFWSISAGEGKVVAGMCFALLLLLATLLEQHSYLGAYGEDAARYAELGALFDVAAVNIPDDDAGQSQLGDSLAQEALAELGFWYATHRPRAPKAMKG